MESNPKKLLVDVDTGIDDALALILIAKIFKNTDIVITTSGGNCTVEDSTRNTLSIRLLTGLQAKIYKGAAKPIAQPAYKNAYDFHGNNGLANITLPSEGEVEEQSASDFIVDYLNTGEDKKTILWLSAATNLAQALSKDPKIARKVERVILMGGTVDVAGNETEFAEFNFYQDPEAIEIVLDSLADKIELIPLDVTNQCPIKLEDLDEINNSKIGKFVKQAVGNWYDFFGKAKSRYFFLYDPLAASLLSEDFVKFTTDKFDFCTTGSKKGALTRGSKYNIKYGSSVNSRAFVDYFIKSVNS